VRVAEVSHSLDLAAATTHACVLTQGGRVECWGVYPGALDVEEWNPAPELSAAARLARLGALPKDTRSIATTGTTLCGVRANGQVACIDPALASGAPAATVKLAPNLTGATAISAGSGMFCATRSGGAQCWYALSAVGRKFDDVSDITLEPAEVEDPCIVRSNGDVECWTTAQFLDPQVPGALIGGVRGAIAVTGGGALACALERGGNVVCWNAAEPRPREFDSVRVPDARTITAFHHGVCATTGAGQVLCHGLDSAGRLERTASVVFERGVHKVVSGGSFLCAQHDDGGVSCWGDNSLGQCGVSPQAPELPRKMLSLANDPGNK
jgi:hypothetical protein